tara:strand:- start:490 stop:960 length:471 start_codon:yes stop_codon:yes gene_type:complete
MSMPIVPDASLSEGVVSELREDDLEQVTRIETKSFGHPWSRDELLTLIRAADILSLAVRYGGRVVGYAVGYREEETFHLASLAVEPGRRRAGNGTRLLSRVLEEASATCRRCNLEVRYSNHAARRLYVRHGFTTDSIRWNHYADPGDHALLMGRNL